MTRIIDKKTGVFSQQKSKVLKVILWGLTFIFLNLTWVIFRADSIEQAFEFYRELFSFNFVEINREFLKLMEIDGVYLLSKIVPVGGYFIKTYFFAMLFVTAFVLSVFMQNVFVRIREYKLKWYHPVITAGILFWCIMSFGGESSFLYWNF